MASILPNMSLASADHEDDLFSYETNSSNLLRIDFHDHAPGRGVQIPEEGIQDGAISATKLAPGALTVDAVSDGAISTSKLENLSVTGAKLAANSVTTDKIVNGTITAADLADGAVSETKLVDGSVTGPKLAPGSVGTAKILDANVTRAKLAPDALNSFLKLFVSGDVAVQFSSATVDGAFNGADPFSQQTFVVPHTLGRIPKIVDINLVGGIPAVRIQEPPGAVAAQLLPTWAITAKATNSFTVLFTVPGISNNGFHFDWMVIG